MLSSVYFINLGLIYLGLISGMCQVCNMNLALISYILLSNEYKYVYEFWCSILNFPYFPPASLTSTSMEIQIAEQTSHFYNHHALLQNIATVMRLLLFQQGIKLDVKNKFYCTIKCDECRRQNIRNK